MQENSFASMETKPPLIWTETFCGEDKTDCEGMKVPPCVPPRAQRLAVGRGHPAVALNAFSAHCSFGTQEKNLISKAERTQSSQQYSQQSNPSGCQFWTHQADGKKQNNWGKLSKFNTYLTWTGKSSCCCEVYLFLNFLFVHLVHPWPGVLQFWGVGKVGDSEIYSEVFFPRLERCFVSCCLNC